MNLQHRKLLSVQFNRVSQDYFFSVFEMFLFSFFFFFARQIQSLAAGRGLFPLVFGGREEKRERFPSRPPNTREKTPLPPEKCNLKFMPTVTFVLVDEQIYGGRVQPVYLLSKGPFLPKALLKKLSNQEPTANTVSTTRRI